VEQTLRSRFVADVPKRLIGDRAYDSDPLDQRLFKEQGIELIAPHKCNRKKPKTQDGRRLRRYKKRWRVERLFAWLFNFRRLVVRFDRYISIFLAFIQLGCIKILLSRY
jgi:transposase